MPSQPGQVVFYGEMPCFGGTLGGPCILSVLNIKNMAIYLDLAGVSTQTSPHLQQQSLELLQTLGYTTCATETIISASKVHTLQASSSVSSTTTTTSSTSTSSSSSSTSTTTKKRKRPQQASTPPVRRLQRVTIQVNSKNDFDLIGSTQSKKLEHYDLVAVLPTSDEAFIVACAREDVDVISIDASSRLPFRPKPQHVGPAIARGVFFELRYSGALQSDTCRQYFITNATLFIRACRSRGLILSSGSKERYQIRGAHDMANLMCLCGVKGMEKALQFVSSNAQHVVERASLRRLLKGAKSVDEEVVGGGDGAKKARKK